MFNRNIWYIFNQFLKKHIICNRLPVVEPMMKHETPLIGWLSFSPATIKQAVSVVTPAVSATQADWQSSVNLHRSDWLHWSDSGENRNCLWRVGVLAKRKAGWVDGQGRLYTYTGTHTHTQRTHCCGKSQGLDVLHKMLTCQYNTPTVFSLWLVLTEKNPITIFKKKALSWLQWNYQWCSITHQSTLNWAQFSKWSQQTFCV